MKTYALRVAALAVGLVSVLGGAPRAQAEWITLAPADAAFSVLVPAAPNVGRGSDVDEGVPYTYVNYSVAHGNMVYVIYDAVYPPGTKVDEQLIADAFVKSIQGRIVAQRRLSIPGGGDRARLLEVSAVSADLSCAMDVIVDANRTVSAAGCSKGAIGSAAEITQFLNSLVLRRR